MSLKRASLLAGAATVAVWLVQPAQAQELNGQAIPDELRIIEDLPEAVEEGRRALGPGDDALGEEDVLTGERLEEGRTVLDSGRETLFGGDQSVLSAPAEESPAERLLPDRDDVPEISLDPRSPDEDRGDPPAGFELDMLSTGGGPPEDGAGPAESIAEPTEPSGPDAEVGGTTGSGTAGSGGGGSGSLF